MGSLAKFACLDRIEALRSALSIPVLGEGEKRFLLENLRDQYDELAELLEEQSEGAPSPACLESAMEMRELAVCIRCRLEAMAPAPSPSVETMRALRS